MEINKSETVAIIRSLLSSTNFSYSIYKLNSDFKNETGTDIPLFGYNNVSDFLQSIPDTVKVTGLYPIQQVSLVQNEKSAHIVSLVSRQRTNEHKRRHKSISRKISLHTRAKDIQKVQNPERKISLKSPKDQIGYSKNVNIRLDVTSDHGNAELPPQSHSTRLESLKNFLSIEESIPNIEMKFHAQVGDYIEVCPCKIFSPHKFYFNFRKFKKKFSEFMDELQLFYKVQEGIPKLTKESIKPKLICAAFYKIQTEPKWHRAEVHKLINESEVIVNLIDNGDVVKISTDNLKYLHRNFMLLPRQAVLGSLANIVPSNGSSDWSQSAIRRFFDLSFGKDLVAGVVHIDLKVFRMNLALSYTKGLEIHINDTLVKEGYAEFDTSLLNAHFADILKIPSSWNRDEKKESEKTKCRNKFIAKSEEKNDVSAKLRAPIFYFPNNYSSNERLQKMFSSVDG